MGILDVFKKKAPGHCIACKDAVAKYRCPVCGKEYCEACVKRSAQTLEETAQAPRIKVSIVSGGVVNTRASLGIESRVQERKNLLFGGVRSLT